MQSLAARNDVKTVVCDQCMFGMNVDGMGLNRKRTKWLSNIPEVLEALDVGCDGSHTHRVLENGRPKLAQVYPEELCRTVAQAIIRFHHTRKLGHYPVELDEEEEEEGPGPEMPRGEAPGNYEPSEEEKKAIMKVHRSVGHPHQQEFIRFLRAARVQGELIQWAYKHFKCDVCQANAHPKVPRPTALPRAYQPNRVIGLDLFYVPSPGGGKQTTPVLNIIDWGTNYQMCELLDGKNPAEVWGAYLSTWARTFGHPEVITCDAGREFLGEFIQRASSEGIVVHQIASKAPWQQGGPLQGPVEQGPERGRGAKPGGLEEGHGGGGDDQEPVLQPVGVCAGTTADRAVAALANLHHVRRGGRPYTTRRSSHG